MTQPSPEHDFSAAGPDPHTERLLDAAKAAFMTHGYAAASMDRIARAAQASKTTLYSRFPSKEALFVALVRRECARRGVGFRPDAFDDRPATAALREIGDRFLDLLWSPEALRVNQVVTGESMLRPEIARLFYDAAVAPAIDAVTAYCARAMERGALPPGDARFIAEQFLASLQGGPYCMLSLGIGQAPGADARRAYAARVVDLFINGAAPGKTAGRSEPIP